MAMRVKEQKKAVVVAWHIEGDEEFIIKGDKATLSSFNPKKDEKFDVDKTIDNDGNGTLLFPMHYKGPCVAKVRGNVSGEDKLEFEVK